MINVKLVLNYCSATTCSGTTFATFLNSFRNVLGHCICVQLMGIIATPVTRRLLRTENNFTLIYLPSSLCAITTPNSFSAVLS